MTEVVMKKLIFAAVAAALAPACAHTPKTPQEEATLESKTSSTLSEMRQKDPSIDQALRSAYAYAIFPEVGKAGFIAGGASGAGILYEQGRPTGNVRISQASFGAQAGAETFAELVLLHNQDEVNKLKNGSFDLGANASAVVLKAGGAAASATARGTSVFVMPKGGAMVDISVAGQKIKFEPFAG
ncbi:MAG TPA: lipid-binding SYLF domain-containing protein [Kofleriaceae bacterium]